MSKGGSVTPLFVIFVGCLVFCAFGLWTYENKDKTAFGEIKQKFDIVVAERKALSERVAEAEDNRKMLLQALDAVTSRVTNLEIKIKEYGGEVDVFRDQVGETLRKQMSLRDDLSKRHVRSDMQVKFEIPKGPFQVQLIRPEKTTPSISENVEKVLPQKTELPTDNNLKKSYKQMIIDREVKKERDRLNKKRF